ncbi:two-component system regulatory protein YycI [Alicyclobacillus dauci]|uniref:Two-component system regulatory protein YycI n=1 Tax=Alicyclobacillus dauci TaxID=1475485 RepID=A0ABY6Z4P3_9BACL|nr:two-component system regulatory protein YycI [Alicyclobacillus dauci]WAH36980.1 two-component system regulatory protein YycI [Alicyclobacillus dauci]
MNWEIAKNWLLVLFVVLDGLLGWQLYSSRQVMNGYAESQADLLANTKTLLAEHGLTLTSDVPTKQPDLASFQAQTKTPVLKDLQTAIFPRATKPQISNSVGQVSTDGGDITLLSDASWQVTFSKPQTLTSKRDSRSFAYQGDLYVTDSVDSTTKRVVFLQAYKDYPIFDSRLITNQTGNNLFSYTQSEIDSIRPTSDPKPVISALDALDSLANSVDKSEGQADNKILMVDLGFARKVPLYQTGVPTNYWFPVWRVATQGGTYYVNAFTGEVEIAP